nr:MAG TPA: hypothetical protein [Caudoviricetes sp.]
MDLRLRHLGLNSKILFNFCQYIIRPLFERIGKYDVIPR